MLLLRRLAEVRRLAGLPQALEIGAVASAANDGLVGRELAERRLVLGFLGKPEPGHGRGRRERAHEARQRLEVEPGVAPFGGLDRGEDMALDRRHDVGVEVGRVAGDAEGAVLAKAPGAAGDLADLLGVEPSRAPSVELAQAREGDMVDVHVEAHADGVGRDEKVDLAGLEELDLRVAGARAQGPHHHRRAAPMAPDEFSDGVDRVGREGDDSAAPRQAGQLPRPVVAQRRQALAELERGVGTEAAHERRDGRRAHEHRLRGAARMQKPVGEHMAALGVGAELDFVDREELDLAVERHRFDRADKISRIGGDDLFLAGDEGDLRLSPRLDDPVVDFARKKPQGQPDHPRGMGQHALDREMGLAGVGRAEDGDQTRARRVVHEANVEDDGPRRKPRRFFRIFAIVDGVAARPPGAARSRLAVCRRLRHPPAQSPQGGDIHALRPSRGDEHPCARSAVQIPFCRLRPGGASLDGRAMERRSGLVRGGSLPRLVRHPQQPHAAVRRDVGRGVGVPPALQQLERQHRRQSGAPRHLRAPDPQGDPHRDRRLDRRHRRGVERQAAQLAQRRRGEIGRTRSGSPIRPTASTPTTRANARRRRSTAVTSTASIRPAARSSG